MQLDYLESRGELTWTWGYDTANSRAIFNVALRDQPWHSLDTRAAESLVQACCEALGIVWLPVPHPGGERQRAEVLRLIEEKKR